MKLRLLITLTAVLTLTAVVTADKVDLNLIGADAAWFTHFDMQKFDGSALNKIADSRGLAAKCEEIKNYIGLDLIKDITEVTMYGSIEAPKDAAAIIKGRLDPKNLTALAEKQPEYSASQYEGFTIHTWKSGKGEVKSGCFYNSGTLVMSKSKESIIAALDVLGGKSPNIAKAGCITSQDAIFQLYMADASSISSKSEHLMFLANVKKTLLAIGQKDSDVFSELIMQADTADNAVLLDQMIQGLLAMGQMQAAQQNQGALEVIKKISVNTEDTTVVTSVVLTTDEIDQIIASKNPAFSKICKSLRNGCGEN